MKITRTQANEVLAAMGWNTANKWTDSKVLARLEKVAALSETDSTVGDPEVNKIIRAMAEAHENGEAIEIGEAEAPAKKSKGKKAPAKKAPAKKKSKRKAPPVEEEEEDEDEPDLDDEEEDEEDEEDEEEAPPPPPRKKGKGKKTAPAKKEKSTEPKAKKAAAEKDKWGNRVGSQAAVINAVVSRKSKSVDEMVEETGLGKARVQGHMNYLLKRDLIEKTSKGYRAKKA